MEYRKNILEAIGNTPIVKLNKVVPADIKGQVFVKCEFLNPGGSIKDRIGLYMIEKAEKAGLLKPGGTVIEATSGNTGMGLALASAIKGYKCIFVMPSKMSEEKRQALRAFGAQVVITPSGVAPDSPESHYSVGARLAKETPNSFYSNQYHNLDNRETHYHWTGPEILKQTGGDFDALIAGLGTMGTISGIGQYIKEKKPSIKIVGVDPKGSILKEYFEKGTMGEANVYKVEGIGEDMIPGNANFKVIDKVVQIEDKESLLMTRNLLKEEGIYAGTSSGAAVVGAIKYLQEIQKPERVIVILPDSGNRYLSKVYTDAWMKENNFL
jgi:cystathionine beta-synthase